jgi:hypothetical protein
MNIDQPFYIFSVELPELGQQENADRTYWAAMMLRRDGFKDFTMVRGIDDNCVESQVFMMMDADWVGSGPMRDMVMRLTTLFEQEEFLYVDANRRTAFYNSLGGRTRQGNGWREVAYAGIDPCLPVTITPDGRIWLTA